MVMIQKHLFYHLRNIPEYDITNALAKQNKPLQ